MTNSGMVAGATAGVPIGERLYGAALGLAWLASPLAERGHSKLARGLRGRRGAPGRLEDWASSHRDPARPLVWFHAPSVGEGLQAQIVLERLLEGLLEGGAEVQVAYTHFSPSALGLAARMPADVADYLPWDLPAPMTRALDALAPALIVFTKTEVWPTLSRLACERGIPTALVAGTLTPGSSRRGRVARAVLAPAHRRLALADAIAEGDATRLVEAGVRPEVVRVTGDPGIDSAAQRAEAADPEAPHLRPFRTPATPTLVAGSTWPSDEMAVVPAAKQVRGAIPGMRLIVAPHEPGTGAVASLRGRLLADGWRVATLAEVEAHGHLGGWNAVIVDRVGILAQLYTVGSVAYVGGGFHAAGLHSVLEPAAAGLPVSFGPGHRNARAAADLLERGAARSGASARELADIWTEWLGQDAARRAASSSATGYIAAHRGAARRSATALAAILPVR